MKRRKFFERAGLGSAAFVALSAIPSGSSVKRADEPGEHEHLQHENVEGPLSNAVVSFGQWPTDFTPPVDRYPNVNLPPAANNHQLIPFEAKIKAGGSVMFVIAGLHNPTVYDDGTDPLQIDTTLTVPTTGTPAGVLLINDPNHRLYRGPDPSLFPRDRTESVHFPTPGRFLVICGVRGHFVNDNMFGYVSVLP
jgi:hypothetical protein